MLYFFKQESYDKMNKIMDDLIQISEIEYVHKFGDRIVLAIVRLPNGFIITGECANQGMSTLGDGMVTNDIDALRTMRECALCEAKKKLASYHMHSNLMDFK